MRERYDRYTWGSNYMNSRIREMKETDRPQVLEMMRAFYASPAVFTNGSDEIFANDIEACISGSPWLEGYILEEENGIQGYAMLAKSFSTEFGRPCIWIEDLFVKEEYRGAGIGRCFMKFIMEKHAGCVFRLEVEKENERAFRLYKNCGFEVLPYTELKK